MRKAARRLGDPGSPDGSGVDDIRAYNEALQAFLAACRADAPCDGTFPNLEKFYTDQYHALEQQPWVVTTQNPFGGAPLQVLIDGDASVIITLLALQLVGPGEVTVAVHSDAAQQANLVAAFVAQQSDLDPTMPWSWGSILSEFCEDEHTAGDRTGVEADIARFPLFAGIARDPSFEVCGRWPTKQRSAVTQALPPADPPPALVISGAIDPYSPASYAERSAAQFKQATLAVFPTLSAFPILRGPPCVAALRLDFLRDPKAKLDVDGCIAQVPPVKFAGT